MSTPGPIGMFDSGLGGLTVLRSLIDLLPHEQIVYFGDTGRFPYGPKPPDEVLAYSLEIAEVLCERGARVIVVAPPRRRSTRCARSSLCRFSELSSPACAPRSRRAEPGVSV